MGETSFKIARKNWPLVQNILLTYGTEEFFSKTYDEAADQVIVLELREEITLALFKTLSALAC